MTTLLTRTVATSALVAGLLGGGAMTLSTSAVAETPPGVSGPALRDDADTDEMRAAATRRFTVTNLTGSTLRYLGPTDTNTHGEFPDSGTEISPGGQLSWEVTWRWLLDNTIRTNFAVVGTGHRISVDTTVGEWAGLSSSGRWSSGGGQVKVSDSGDGIQILDAPGTVVEVPNGQGQHLTGVLERLVASGQGEQDFAIRSRSTVTGPTTIVGSVMWNNTPLVQSDSFAKSTAIAATDTVTVAASLKASIMKVVEVTVTATYGHTWTTTETYTQTSALNVPAYSVGYQFTVPVFDRTTGDYTVRIGDTTFVLRGVSFDTPRPQTDATYIGKYTRDMTAEERATVRPGVELQAPSAAVSAVLLRALPAGS